MQVNRPSLTVSTAAPASGPVDKAERQVLLFLLAVVTLVSSVVLGFGEGGIEGAQRPELGVVAPVCGLLFLVLLRSPRFLAAAKVLIVATGAVAIHGRLGLAFFAVLSEGYRSELLPSMAIWTLLVTAVSIMMFRGTAGHVVGLALYGATAVMVLAFVAAAPPALSARLGPSLVSEYIVGQGAVVSLLLLYRRVEQALTQARKRADEQQRLAHTDPLTQLRNRRVGTVLLERLIARRQRGDTKQFALVMFDIDHFKRVNDEYGHHIGDRVLVEVANLACTLTRPWDTVCRWGGEEFLVIVSDADVTPAHAIAERLRNGVASLRIDELPAITASFGYTSVLNSDTHAALLERVDDALYAAKEGGRDCVKGA